MAILVNSNTKVLVQGITGKAGAFHTIQMLEAGTKIVGGVTPGKGGELFEGRIPVFDTVEDAVENTEANATVIFVPAPFAGDAIMEAASAKIELIVCITEGIPVLDMLEVVKFLNTTKSRLIGPNCPGIIAPSISQKLGIIPHREAVSGNIGVVSRSGTLTYEAIRQLRIAGYGQSTCIGIGGDPVGGIDFVDVLSMFEEDSETDAVVLIGEIGGSAEEKAATFIKENMKKKVICYIAGLTAPPGKRMGHAGAVISGGKGKASDKLECLRAAGAVIVEAPSRIASTLSILL